MSDAPDSPAAKSERYRRLEGRNLYRELLDWRDRQRQNAATATRVVKQTDLPWEVNPQGIMRWYMHPAVDDTWIKAYMIYQQRLPVGSRSGRQRHPGNLIFYVWKGKGHTTVDGVRFDWERHDLIQIPLRKDGTEFQHFNDGDEDAFLVACEPNNMDGLGVDRGTGFEQLEECPEYIQSL